MRQKQPKYNNRDKVMIKKILISVMSSLLFASCVYAESNMHVTVKNNTSSDFFLNQFQTNYGEWRETAPSTSTVNPLNYNSVLMLQPSQSVKLSLSHTDSLGIGSFSILETAVSASNCDFVITANNSAVNFDLSKTGACIFDNQNYFLQGDFGSYTITHPDFYISIEDHNE